MRNSEPGDSRSDDPPCREAAAHATLRNAKNAVRQKPAQTPPHKQTIP